MSLKIAEQPSYLKYVCLDVLELSVIINRVKAGTDEQSDAYAAIRKLEKIANAEVLKQIADLEGSRRGF